MIASDNDTVRELNQRARAHRVGNRDVTAQGVAVASGVTVGVGDRIVTRRNDRTLCTGRSWVKNGDHWTVTAVRKDGAITVQRTSGAARILLPANYVRDNVDLGYATNAHRAQGRTVDTAHSYITTTTQRELLYVMATRGRDANHLYVDTVYDPDIDTLHGPVEEQSPLDVLTRVLANEGGDKSATETIRSEWDERTSISRVWAEYETIAATDRAVRYDRLLDQSGLTAVQQQAVRESESYGPLMAAFGEADARGLGLADVFPKLVQGRGLTRADDIGSVLHHRVDRWIAASGRSQRFGQDRIVGLFPHAVGVTDRDTKRALDDRRALLEQRAQHLAMAAIECRHPWAAQLGTRPEADDVRASWMRAVAVVAAFRERWNIHDRTILGPVRESAEQQNQRALAQRAVNRALAIHRQAPGDGITVARHIERPLDRGIEL
jgi:hypothetical protein